MTTTFDYIETLNIAVTMINATIPAIAIAAGVIVASWVVLRLAYWVRRSL